MSESKEPIRLRKRKTSKGMTSLYLDIYLNGKRSYEFLNSILSLRRAVKTKERTQRQ